MADLRYPNTPILDSKMDWFQIQAYKYDAKGSGIGIARTETGSLLSSGRGTTPLGTVILPMPSNIQDGNSVNYGEDNLNTLTAKGVNIASDLINVDAGKLLQGDIGQLTIAAQQAENLMGDLMPIIKKSLAAEAVSIFGGNVTLNSLLARESGQILNPNMELLFNGVTLRTFRFSFKMTPRDNNESDNIKSIIRFLKRHMAPKAESTFLNTPSIFELMYRKGKDKHPFLHSFKPCFLKDMSVNYTGENTYATYSDGTPISMIMDLTFQEAEPIYEKDYVDEKGNDLDSTVGY